MGSLVDYGENKFLDHIFNAAYSPVATVYLVLCTADPTDAATGASCNEHADTAAYARAAISFGTAAARRITQDAVCNFVKATGTWTEITHWCIADNASHGVGNILAAGAFATPFTPVSGNTVQIASGQVWVQINATTGGAGFTDDCVHNMLELMFDNQAYAKPDTFIGFATATIADADGTIGEITEITGTSYARKQVNINGGGSPTWDLAASGVVDNTDQIDMASPGAADWDQIVSMFIADIVSGAGNVLCYDNDNIPDQTPGANDDIYFEAGALDITVT